MAYVIKKNRIGFARSGEMGIRADDFFYFFKNHIGVANQVRQS